MAAKRIDLVAIDGSDQAKYAFRWYLDNLFREGCEVVLVHCCELNINIGLPGAAADVDAICEQVKQKQVQVGVLTEDFMAELRKLGIPSKLVTPHEGGKPGELICKAAKEYNVNGIVIGTRGLGKIRRTLLGSVSEYVAHHAGVPVTIVRQPE